MESAETSLTLAVLEAVAAAENVDPVDLPVPLNNVVDTDSLDSLFRNGAGRVTFDYAGYAVNVDEVGDVDVAPLQDA